MSDAMVWVKAGMFLRRFTKDLLGLSMATDGPVQLALPRSVIGRLEYDEGGDSRDLRVGHFVRTIECKKWFAEQKKLTIVDE
jgi:hypothetical protein